MHVPDQTCHKWLQGRHSPILRSCLQGLVAFEMVATPLNAPFALAAHLPPNLTTLKLQYLPDTWPPDDIPPDEWQVLYVRRHTLHLVYLPTICFHASSRMHTVHSM